MSKKIEIQRMSELPVIPITIGDMSFNRTGLWRFLEPVIQDKLAPCQLACPLGMPSPIFIADLVRQDANQALARILEVNPLPGVTGRLCYHPCQANCLRRHLDQPIQIQALERYVAEKAKEPSFKLEARPKARVGVLGAGPVGLAAAYFLGRAGLRATVIDPLERAGGFLTEVDEERLPAAVLANEVARLSRLAGLELRLSAEVEAVDFSAYGWDLVIHDKTAHDNKSEAGVRLASLAKLMSRSSFGLDTESLFGNEGYKASQVGLALANGRRLAFKAMEAMDLRSGEIKLEAVANSAVSQERIRYDLFVAQPRVETYSRTKTISEAQAHQEAGRCFSCGHCNLCGRCLIFCPDVSLRVNEENQRPAVDLEHCKGCGICAHECPRGVISMERKV